MKLKLFSILTAILLAVFTQFTIAQELDEIVEELKDPLDLSDTQVEQFNNLLGQYATQLNQAMEKNEDADAEKDPQAMISQFKAVRDSYRDDLQKILSKEQYEKYREIVFGIILEMFTDIAEIRLMDLQKPLELTDGQIQKLAPVMGKSMMEIMEVVVEYGDKRMSMPRKVKVGKKLKAIQAEANDQIERILTPQQLATWQAMKEESKAEKEGK
jgi:hypothetical protein